MTKYFGNTLNVLFHNHCDLCFRSKERTHHHWKFLPIFSYLTLILDFRRPIQCYLQSQSFKISLLFTSYWDLPSWFSWKRSWTVDWKPRNRKGWWDCWGNRRSRRTCRCERWCTSGRSRRWWPGCGTESSKPRKRPRWCWLFLKLFWRDSPIFVSPSSSVEIWVACRWFSWKPLSAMKLK